MSMDLNAQFNQKKKEEKQIELVSQQMQMEINKLLVNQMCTLLTLTEKERVGDITHEVNVFKNEERNELKRRLLELTKID